MMALLQPSPEVFQLFDDIMLLSDGMCVYFGPREGVLPFFESQGFRCPPRMPVPGFLQNITSRRDQQVGSHPHPVCGSARCKLLPLVGLVNTLATLQAWEAMCLSARYRKMRSRWSQ